MSLTDAVAVKLDAYALFCRQLLTHLPALHAATLDDLRVPCAECCQRFGESLSQCLSEGDPTDLPQAVRDFSVPLRGRVGLLQNPQAIDIFERVIADAAAAAPSWRYQDDLETLHRQGWRLAQHFYTASPWPVAQDRRERRAQLTLDDGQGPVMGFHAHYLDEETDQELLDVIQVRFDFGHNFGVYLAYPYLFMHEYVAHIFACDHENERFNDGWLLHAADCYLARHGWELDVDPPLTREQISAFGEHLYKGLPSIAHNAVRLVRDFKSWLADPARFDTLTWELAAFEPRQEEDAFWPNQFINRIEQAFNTDRSLLRRKMTAAPDARALFEMLTPV